MALLSGGLAIASATTAAHAQVTKNMATGAQDALTTQKTPVSEIISLWPTEPPGGIPAGLKQRIVPRGGDPHNRAVEGITHPEMQVFHPAVSNGTAILLCQGGGYVHIAQSPAVPAFLTRAGFTVFDLLYRLPGDGWAAGPNAPHQDAQRAIRIIRARAAEYGIHKIGVMGFSAGGHVAGSLTTRFAEKTYTPVDAADQQSTRPDFAALSCPVLTMHEPFAHHGSKVKLLGHHPTASDIEQYSCADHIGPDTPHVFLVHADDDPVVPPENSMLMAMALHKHKIPCELHLFQEGGHGMSTDLPLSLPAAFWPQLFLAWVHTYHFA